MEQILPFSVLATYRDIDVKIESGPSATSGNNSGKKFLIIGAAGAAGLGTVLHGIALNVRYARENGYIPVVDMMTYRNQYLYDEEIGKVNAWEKFFLQPAGYNLDDAMKSKNVYLSAVYRRLDEINDETNLFDFLKPNCQVMEFVNLMKEQLSGKKLLGVLFRGTDYANLRPFRHSIQPTLKQMIMKVKEKMDEWGSFDGIYVCTEVEEAIEKYKHSGLLLPAKAFSSKHRLFFIHN